MQPKLIGQHKKDRQEYNIGMKTDQDGRQVEYPGYKRIDERYAQGRGVIVDRRTVMDTMIAP